MQYANVREEAAHQAQVAERKHPFIYTVEEVVANNTTYPALLQIEDDAHFQVTHITISALGPTDENGVRQNASASDFDLAGTSTGYADRGLAIQLSESGGRKFTSGFVPIELMGAPGYGLQYANPYPFKHLLKRNTTLSIDIRNRDTASGLYHAITIAFNGFKYLVA